MLGICIYDIGEIFGVAKISTTNFISKNSSIQFPFFGYTPLYTFMAGNKIRHDIIVGTFYPKLRRVLSMQKCIETVVPKTWERKSFSEWFFGLCMIAYWDFMWEKLV